MQLASSTEYLFLQDQTAFKGTARYDGRPLAGEAFVIVNYNNQAPTTSKSFANDDANDVTEIRLNTHTAAITGTGTYQLKAITAPGKGTVTWTSGTTAKATVSSTGLVTGVASGTSVITATCNGVSDSCTVTVS
ncbi:MAG: Ig-like domain-containing protein [Clostridia bacterium]|nr:Ig-like domain-containing protein [Clostridia bacterium]